MRGYKRAAAPRNAMEAFHLCFGLLPAYNRRLKETPMFKRILYFSASMCLVTGTLLAADDPFCG